MPDSFTFVGAVLVAGAFGWAALSKLVGYERWRRALAGYKLPGTFERAARLGTPVMEAFVVVVVLFGPLPLAGALTLALLAGFCVVVVRARAVQGDRLPCGCFGGATERDYRLMLVRNTVLAVPAGALVLSGDPGLIDRIASIEGSEILPLGLVLMAGGLVVWVTMGLLELQSGKGENR
ncbi:MAG: MauE/DoxX family redox-associated membrane protein [Actinomycetota bacterium]